MYIYVAVKGDNFEGKRNNSYLDIIHRPCNNYVCNIYYQQIALIFWLLIIAILMEYHDTKEYMVLKHTIVSDKW